MPTISQPKFSNDHNVAEQRIQGKRNPVTNAPNLCDAFDDKKK